MVVSRDAEINELVLSEKVAELKYVQVTEDVCARTDDANPIRGFAQLITVLEEPFGCVEAFGQCSDEACSALVVTELASVEFEELTGLWSA